MNNKTIARIACVQALYEWEFNGRVATFEEVIKNITNFYEGSQSKLNQIYLNTLLKNAISYIADIDKHIEELLHKKELDGIVLSIARSGISEMLFITAVPYKVVINEYTTIARQFTKFEDIGFINSLLDNFAKSINFKQNLKGEENG